MTNPDALDLLGKAAQAVATEPEFSLVTKIGLATTAVTIGYATGTVINRAFDISCRITSDCEPASVIGTYTVNTNGDEQRYTGCSGGYTNCWWGDLPAGRYAYVSINGGTPTWLPSYSCASPCASYADVKAALDSLTWGTTYEVTNQAGTQVALFHYESDAALAARVNVSAPFVCTGSCASSLIYFVPPGDFTANETQPSTFTTAPFPTLRDVIEAGSAEAQARIGAAIDPTYEGTEVTWLAPEGQETYAQYLARLRAAGWLGTATVVQMSSDNSDSDFDPDGVPCTSASASATIGSLVPVTFYQNASSIGNDENGGSGASCGGVPTTSDPCKIQSSGHPWDELMAGDNAQFYADACAEAWAYLRDNGYIDESGTLDPSVVAAAHVYKNASDLKDPRLDAKLGLSDPADLADWDKVFSEPIPDAPRAMHLHFYRPTDTDDTTAKVIVVHFNSFFEPDP